MLCDITTSSDTGIVTRLQKVSGFTTRKVVQINLLISCIQFMFIFIDFSCFKLSMWIYGLEVVDGLVAEISQSAGIGALNLFLAVIGLELLKLLMNLTISRLIFF